MRRALARMRAVAAGLVVAVLATGCQGAYDLPLPGGAATGSDVYRVAIEFADVLDLVPQSAVKVNDVTVGAVEEVSLQGWQALVTVRLEDDVRLPDNAVAELRQTSLLGEKFVSLGPPAQGASVGELSDGDLIPVERSGRNPEVEEVLGAMSLLLNGGGVAQLQTINRELNNALEGRESDVKSALEQLDVFVGGLEEQKSEIVRAIEALDRLSGTLATQKQDIAVALEQVPGGLRVLADQREQLTQMLTALSELGVVATRVVDASQEDTVANLRALQPVLTRLDEAGSALPDSLELLFTYPFSDGSVPAVVGDYSNLIVTADLDYAALCLELGLPDCELPQAPAPPPPPVTVPPVPLDPCALLPDGALPVDCPIEQICDDIQNLPACTPELVCPVLDPLPGDLPAFCEGVVIPTAPPPGGGPLPTLPPPPGGLPVPTLPGLPGLSGTTSFDPASYDRDLALLLLGGVAA